MKLHVLRGILPVTFGTGPFRRRRRRPRGADVRTAAAVVERLEPRALLTAFLVDTAADAVDPHDGRLSLREALTAANGNTAFSDAPAGEADGDVIRIALADGGGVEHPTGTPLTPAVVHPDGGMSEPPISTEEQVAFPVTPTPTPGNPPVANPPVANPPAPDGPTFHLTDTLRITDDVILFGGGAEFLGGTFDGPLFDVDLDRPEHVILDGLTVRGGTAAGDGGGIRTSLHVSAALGVRHTRVVENHAAGGGGGLFHTGRGRSVVRDTVFAGNSADGHGGAVALAGGARMTVRDALFVTNTADTHGGAFRVESGSHLTLEGTTVRNNRAGTGAFAGTGGGLSVASGAAAAVTDAVFDHNRATGDGGGIHTAGDLSINGSTVTGNTAGAGGGPGSGGGLFATPNANVDRQSSNFSNNGPNDFDEPPVADFVFAVKEDAAPGTVIGTVRPSFAADPELFYAVTDTLRSGVRLNFGEEEIPPAEWVTVPIFSGLYGGEEWRELRSGADALGVFTLDEAGRLILNGSVDYESVNFWDELAADSARLERRNDGAAEGWAIKDGYYRFRVTMIGSPDTVAEGREEVLDVAVRIDDGSEQGFYGPGDSHITVQADDTATVYLAPDIRSTTLLTSRYSYTAAYSIDYNGDGVDDTSWLYDPEDGFNRGTEPAGWQGEFGNDSGKKTAFRYNGFRGSRVRGVAYDYGPSWRTKPAGVLSALAEGQHEAGLTIYGRQTQKRDGEYDPDADGAEAGGWRFWEEGDGWYMVEREVEYRTTIPMTVLGPKPQVWVNQHPSGDPHQNVIRHEVTRPARYAPLRLHVNGDILESATVDTVGIDWGDGSPPEQAAGDAAAFEHAYDLPGTYFVTASASSGDEIAHAVTEVRIPDLGRAGTINFDGELERSGVSIDADGVAHLEFYTRPYYGHEVVGIDWDFDGDGDFYNDVQPPADGTVVRLNSGDYFGLPETGEDGAPLYAARVRLTNDVGGSSVYYHEFTGFPGEEFVTDAVEEERRTAPVTTRPDGFDVGLMYDIVEQLRPDVYQYWKGERGIVDTRPARGWVTGWLTRNVKSTWTETRTGIRPKTILASEFTELEAAEALIYQVENGYFPSHFRASFINRQLSGADDFSSVDAFAKWQSWYRRRMGQTVATGARFVLDYYSMAFEGADLVLTAHDILNEEAHWTHALDAARLLPFIGRLRNSTVVVKDTGGSVVGKVRFERGTDGRFWSRVEAASDTPDLSAILPANSFIELKGYPKSVIQQEGPRCGWTSGEMVLREVGNDVVGFAAKARRSKGGIRLDKLRDEMASAITNPFLKSQIRVEVGVTADRLWRAMNSKRNQHPMIVSIGRVKRSGQAPLSHAVVVDSVHVSPGGVKSFKIRDPGSGRAYSVRYSEFATEYEKNMEVLWFNAGQFAR